MDTLNDAATASEFTPLVHLATQLCAAPTAVVVFMSDSLRRHAAATGPHAQQASQIAPQLLDTLDSADAPFTISDLQRLPGLPASPLRFCAGVALGLQDGPPLGVLAVFDTAPRVHDAAHSEGLRLIALHAQALLKLHSQQQQLMAHERERETLQRQLVAQSESLRLSEKQYRQLFDEHPQPMWIYETHTRRLLAVNRAMVQQYGYSRRELLSMRMDDLWLPEDRETLRAHMAQRSPSEQRSGIERRHVRKDGSIMEVELSSGAAHFNGVPVRHVLAADVTQRRKAEQELARVGRAQRLLSACNEAMVRATSEPALLQAICQIAVDIGGYRMGWVGLAHNDERCSIEPVAHAGYNRGYLELLDLSWNEDQPGGSGPAGRAIRSGQAQIVRNVLTEMAFEDWIPRMLEHGFHGTVVLPLRDGERSFGLLYLYAPEVLTISNEEIALLQELATDMAFGIVSLRARREQQRLQASVLKVAAAVSASTGTEFFEQLVHNMSEALGAQAGCVARLLPPGADGMARTQTMALHLDGTMQPNTIYPLEGTPSQLLLKRHQVVVAQDVAQRYPQAPVLARMNAQGYVGQQLSDADGRPLGLIFVLFREPLVQTKFISSTLQIFAARASAEIQRQLAEQHIRRQASLLDKAQDAITVHDLSHRLLYWNQGAERLYGWSSDQVLEQPVEPLLYPDDVAFAHAGAMVRAHGEWTGEMRLRHRYGHSLDVESRWTLVPGGDGQPPSILVIDTDISQRKATEREIQRLAYYDALTGLPNRMLLMDRIRQALAFAQRNQQGGALLFIDLDNFKTLNDTAGHDKGDLLLQEVAQRLNQCVRSMDTVARLGGDEFVVMIEQLHGEPEALALDARNVGEKILSVLSAPYLLAGYQYRSTPSIGIAPFHGLDASVGELLKQADLAMYQAKTAGRNTLRFFDPDMQAVVTARAALEADLRAALTQDELLLHYQPQMNHLGQPVGVEALVRWAHPQRGLVSPADFIPLAEETGLILPIGRWVLNTACRLLARWQEIPSLAGLTIAVNVSSRQFRHADFVDDVAHVLATTQIPPALLKLELTESQLVEDMEATIATMEALRKLGVGFSLDDFGTGYSSLAYLKRMPLDQLKIDRSFVRDLLTDPNDAAIVETIIALSRSLGLEVIAEGVESAEQRDLLLESGCRYYQGFFFSRPLPEDAFTAYLYTRMI